jgi:hypothetical protein
VDDVDSMLKGVELHWVLVGAFRNVSDKNILMETYTLELDNVDSRFLMTILNGRDYIGALRQIEPSRREVVVIQKGRKRRKEKRKN